LAGYFDTHPQGGANVGIYNDNYDGQWGCYPFLPSKNIFALDQSNGIFMLKTHLYNDANVGNETEVGGGTGVGTYTGTVLTGIQENEFGKNIHLYPNPVNHLLTFNLPVELVTHGYQVSITDIRGKEIYHLSKEESLLSPSVYKSINVESFSTGMYFFNLSVDGNTIKNSKFIIAR
ncbi:MAG: T9SS type A sorting domain-containing protein, partial [Bacteroidia bacterium]